MEGARLIRKLRLTNLLSYGPEGEEIELLPLNVLIGPNGSGKSNLIAALSILQAAPFDFSLPIRVGGGVAEWIYKGSSEAPCFTIEATVSPVPPHFRETLRYRCQVSNTALGMYPYLDQEEVAYEAGPEGTSPSGETLYSLNRGIARIRPVPSPPSPTATTPSSVTERPERTIQEREINPTMSVLAQFRAPDTYPEITGLAQAFMSITLYRDTHFGPRSPLRGPQRTDSPAGVVLEDVTNFNVVLNNLLSNPDVKKRLIDELRRLDPLAEDISPQIFANSVEVRLHEAGLRSTVPATRLSDGVLRYLFLLCILLDKRFPRLVCIEDPEIGLHPDVLPSLANLLVDASQHSQLVVTTHSDILVSAPSDVPEAVVVCERDERGSHLRRLNRGRLEAWLKKYSLGSLWVSGEIGGNP